MPVPARARGVHVGGNLTLRRRGDGCGFASSPRVFDWRDSC